MLIKTTRPPTVPAITATNLPRLDSEVELVSGTAIADGVGGPFVDDVRLVVGVEEDDACEVVD